MRKGGEGEGYVDNHFGQVHETYPDRVAKSAMLDSPYFPAKNKNLAMLGFV